MRGTSGEGQASFLNQFIKGYIEETSVSVASFVRLPNANSYYINNISNADTQGLGQGGEITLANPTPDLALVQQSSVISLAFSQDAIDKNGKRSQTVEYTVQPGDALSFIASDYGVSINSILWANNVKDADSIKPGQVLRIPPISGVLYTIKKGDTISSISKKYQAEEAKVLEFNNLDDESQLRIGAEIIIPDGKPASPGQPKKVIENEGRFAYLPNLVNFFIQPTIGYNWNILHGRNGIDVANSCGTPVYSAAEGSIAIATDGGWNGGYGKYIKIIHSNGTESLYAHLSKTNVGVGAYVTQGQLIGLMGTTGRSTGCHLHFEVHGAKNPLSKR